ncbi:MAG: cytochrome c biogenesis protein CcsA [Gammaproteobacteria bacterium]|nr:cytochrome c biogenesis protein CcsA [Gammaproteobacteria bacterium]
MVLASIVSSLLYLLVAFLQYRSIRANTTLARPTLITLAAVAIALHGLSAWYVLQSPEGINLGFFKISSLIFWIINMATVISLRWRPLENLLVILFPLASLSVLVSALAPGNNSPMESIAPGLLFHIGSSVLAYAVLTIAACQAAVVSAQDYQLHHRHTIGLVQILPPLELMETMLFEIIWVGLILLTLSIASGMVFLEDMFAQHLVHKTVLSICAWWVFSILLWGHHQLGWRSQTAARFTLAGFVVLMLAYFGSKLVLEVILQRV